MKVHHVWKQFPLVKYTSTQIIHKYTNKKYTNTQKAQHLGKLFPPIGHTCQAPTQRTKSHTCHIKVPLGGASTSPLPFCRALCICVFVHLCICNLQKSLTCASMFCKSDPQHWSYHHPFYHQQDKAFILILISRRNTDDLQNSGIHVSSKAIAALCITWPITLCKIGSKIKSFVFVFH